MSISKQKQWLIGLSIPFIAAVFGGLSYCHNIKKEPRVFLSAITKGYDEDTVKVERLSEGSDTSLFITCLEMRQQDFDKQRSMYLLEVPFVLSKKGNEYVHMLSYRITAEPYLIDNGSSIPRFLRVDDKDFIFKDEIRDTIDISSSNTILQYGINLHNPDLVSNGLIDEFCYDIKITQNKYSDRKYVIKNLIFMTENLDSFNISTPEYRSIINDNISKWTNKNHFFLYKYKAFDYNQKYRYPDKTEDNRLVYFLRHATGYVYYSIDSQFYYHPYFYLLFLSVSLFIYCLFMGIKCFCFSHKSKQKNRNYKVVSFTILIVLLLSAIIYFLHELISIYPKLGEGVIKFLQ